MIWALLISLFKKEEHEKPVDPLMYLSNRIMSLEKELQRERYFTGEVLNIARQLCGRYNLGQELYERVNKIKRSD